MVFTYLFYTIGATLIVSIEFGHANDKSMDMTIDSMVLDTWISFAGYAFLYVSSWAS